ncbi:MAG TPA: hypothetical protein VF365_10750 [Candidatus Limnocylindria bacterium]
MLAPIALSTLGLIALIVAGFAVLFFIGGIAAVIVRSRRQENTWEEHVRTADQSLQQARANDRGWDREMMVEVARAALADSRPGFPYSDLHLVLVEDLPGVEEDRAHFVAVGPDGEARVVLGREGERWVAESVV